MKLFKSMQCNLFRTPINCIISLLELVETLPINKDYIENYIEPAVYQGKLLTNLLNDMLDLAQIKAGKFKVSFTNFNLKKLLYETFKIVRVQA